jgi:sodium transport system ATP-binding protein
VIEAHELKKVFEPPRGAPVEAVKGATFTVQDGEIFGLLGPNGAGKTTLLRMLAAIISPTSGHCEIDGASAQGNATALRSKIGFLSGNTKLYGRLTVREMLRYFGRLYRISDAIIEERSEELIRRLDMGAFADRRCESLSTGQSQRVSIARVLLHDPALLILDEPTLGLDIMTSRSIFEFILQAKSRGRSIIFSTHYMTEAEILCDRIALIHRGEIIAIDTKENLYAQTATTNLQDAFLSMVDASDGNGA